MNSDGLCAQAVQGMEGMAVAGVASFTAERRRAVATYKLALEKFPTSTQLLQMYALFLQHVMNAQASSQTVFARVLELAEVREGAPNGASTISGESYPAPKEELTKKYFIY